MRVVYTYMNLNISKRQLVLGFTVIFCILLSIVFIGLHVEKQQKKEYIAQQEEKKEIINKQTQIARKDWDKINTFIINHLPEKEGAFFHYNVAMKMDIEPEYLITYSLEEALKEENVDQWLASFTSDATRDMLNSLKAERLNDRVTEIQTYLKRMSRDGKLETITCFEEKGNQYNLLFSYSDNIEVKVPISFAKMQSTDIKGKYELIINTNVLSMIEQIEKVSS